MRARSRNVDGAKRHDKARSHGYSNECYTLDMLANPRREPEQVAVDRYVVDTLMRDLIGHDRAPSAFVVYLLLWRHSLAAGAPSVQMSLRDIAEGSGLSKRGVQEALTILSRRQLVGISRQSITDVPVYTVNRPWKRTKLR